MKIMEDPYPESPGGRERTIAEAQAQIEAMQTLPQELRDALKEHASQLVERHREPASKNTHFYGGQLGWTHWVVKNDDMNLIAQLSPSAIAITAFLTVAGSNPIVLAVGLTLIALNQLKTARQGDGSIIALVGESGDGLWSTSGI